MKNSSPGYMPRARARRPLTFPAQLNARHQGLDRPSSAEGGPRDGRELPYLRHRENPISLDVIFTYVTFDMH